MSEPRSPRRCPACGQPYGHTGVRCYPGVPAVMTGDGHGVQGFCEQRGKLPVPPVLPDQLRKVVTDLRASGRRWSSVVSYLRRFGLTLPPESRDKGVPPYTLNKPLPPRKVRPPDLAGLRELAKRAEVPKKRGKPNPQVKVEGSRRDKPPASKTWCPQSVTHRHDEGSRTDGKCTWCGYQFDTPRPKPPIQGGTTELGQEYRRNYDPDWGTDHRDV